MKKTYLIAALLITGFIYLITFNEIEVVSPGEGTIVGSSGDVDVVTPDSGFITSMLVKSGDKIHEGDVLFSYNNLDVYYKEKSLDNVINLLSHKKEELMHDRAMLDKVLSMLMKQEVDALENPGANALVFYKELMALFRQKETLENKKEIYQLQRHELEKQVDLMEQKIHLLKTSGSPKVELLESTKQLSQLSYSINELDSKLITETEEYSRRYNDFTIKLLDKTRAINEAITELDLELTSSSDSLNHARRKKQANIIKSPATGTVLDIKQNFTLGSYIEASQKVLTIQQTQDNNLIEAKLLSKYRPFVHNDSDVKIVVNSPGFKHQISGKVVKISADSFEEEQGNRERFFKIEVMPDADLTLEGDLIGIQVNIYIVSKKITIVDYVTSFVNEKVFFNVW